MRSAAVLIIRRPIPGFPGYFADNNGDIWSKKHKQLRLRKPRLDKDGYARVNLSVNGKLYNRGVHQLVALAFIGERPSDEHVVDHIDHSTENNWAHNLRYLHNLVNVAAQDPLGREIRSRARTKFSVDVKAAAVLEYRTSGMRLRDVAAKYGMHPKYLCKINKAAHDLQF